MIERAAVYLPLRKIRCLSERIRGTTKIFDNVNTKNAPTRRVEAIDTDNTQFHSIAKDNDKIKII